MRCTGCCTGSRCTGPPTTCITRTSTSVPGPASRCTRSSTCCTSPGCCCTGCCRPIRCTRCFICSMRRSARPPATAASRRPSSATTAALAHALLPLPPPPLFRVQLRRRQRDGARPFLRQPAQRYSRGPRHDARPRPRPHAHPQGDRLAPAPAPPAPADACYSRQESKGLCAVSSGRVTRAPARCDACAAIAHSTWRRAVLPSSSSYSGSRPSMRSISALAMR